MHHHAAHGTSIHPSAPGRPAVPAQADRALRAATDDRDATVARLQTAYVEGRLASVELSERVEGALNARTLADLDALTADLPPAAPLAATANDATGVAWLHPTPSARPAAEGGFRAHLTSYLLVMGLLVAIWALTSPGGYFWPIWPMLGWGIGVASHGLGARAGKPRRVLRASCR